MRIGDFAIFGVARDAGENSDAEFVEQRLHLPQFAGKIVFADDVDVVRRGIIRLFRSDHVIEQRFAGELVAEVLRPDEAGRVDGNHRLAEFLARRLADRVDVVADHGGNAGLIDEDRRRIVFLDDFLDRLVEPLLTAEHDVGLVDVGGETGAPDVRAGGFGAAIVPGISLAGDRTVNEMGDIGQGLQRDLGAVKGAAAGGAARLQLLGAALLAFGLRLVGVLAAAGLVEDILDLGRQRTHSSLLPGTGSLGTSATLPSD